MSDQNFVYGVFEHIEDALPVVGKLHDAGFKTAQLGVLAPRGKDFQYVSGKVADPAERNYLLWGTFGCIGGLCAGIVGAPHIANLPFQILTPLMAAMSGGVVISYFGSFMGMFLNSGKPQHWANVFEGTIEAGEIVVLAECASRTQMKDAMAIIESAAPLELIARQSTLGKLLKSENSPEVEIAEPVRPILSAVA